MEHHHRTIVLVLLVLLLLLPFCSSSSSSPLLPTQQKLNNILFLVVDDLRPNIGSYWKDASHPNISAYTPNLDRLAREGFQFNFAYAQQAYCSPSRNSFMTGRRPDTTQSFNFVNHFRQVGPSWTSLPQHFKNHGYFTQGSGKLFHSGLPPNFDQPLSWTQKPFQYMDAGGNCTTLHCHCSEGQWDSPWCAVVSDPGYLLQDQENCGYALERLRYAASLDTPFFIGFGLHRPHLQWRFPERFLAHFPPPSEIPVAAHQDFPDGTPAVAFHSCAEFNIPFSNATVRNANHPSRMLQSELRRAYYATISYMDHHIGQILDELDRLGHTNDTAIVVFADHGWQLGEHDMWCKMSNFEIGTRVPLIFRVPWKLDSIGKQSNVLVELVDVFPTLSELVGLSVPAGENLQGTSLVPLFDHPDDDTLGNKVAISQHPRCFQNNVGYKTQTAAPDIGKCGDEQNHTNSLLNMCDCHWTPKEYIDIMGYSMRTPRYRYTEWAKWDTAKLRPLWDQLYGTELYDHTEDLGYNFDEFENRNQAFDPEFTSVVRELSATLHASVEKWWD